MIEITYADMFLIVIILTLLGLWVRAVLELRLTKLLTLNILRGLYEKDAELYEEDGMVLVRKAEKNV